MKKTQFDKRIQKVQRIKMAALDIFIQRVVEALEELGNPETLIKKHYDDWTYEDTLRLIQLYGKEPNELSRLIFRREYAKLKQLGGV